MSEPHTESVKCAISNLLRKTGSNGNGNEYVYEYEDEPGTGALQRAASNSEDKYVYENENEHEGIYPRFHSRGHSLVKERKFYGF